MRKPTAALAVPVIAVLLAGCGATGNAAEPPATTPSLIPRPLVERELAGLLLSPDEVNAAMGSTAMAVTGSGTSMADNSATMAPAECLSIDGSAEAAVYAGSGFWAERDQSLNDGDAFTHYLKQAVVLFPTVEDARAFLDASAGQWSTCHGYSHTQSGSEWEVAPIVTGNDVVSTTARQREAAAPGWGCGRALAHRNNIIVDVNTCSHDPADSAARIAGQIADKVTARW
jgi:hypothetical protein